VPRSVTRSSLIRSLALACVLVVAALSASPPPPGFQLPEGVVPLKYNVELWVDPTRETFEGTVGIRLRLDRFTPVIWLNAKDLEIESVSLGPDETFLGAGDVVIRAHARVVNKELIAIDTEKVIGGTLWVWINYRGHLDDKGVLGAYRRKVDGSWYVYTTFTPIEARRVIPCFDDPRFKTPWQISIKIPQGQMAFSNTPEISENMALDGQQMIHFGETKPLPSELIAFAVGPFDVYEGQPAGHGTPIRVITPKGHAADGKPAADAAVAVLPRLEEYTGIPYPFGKLDHLALAEGAFGAVENPGLITYLARELLMIPGTDTNPRTHALRLLEAHEIGHQWFGDMVTQSSWADVWLSEGFATWISEKVMDQEEPPARAHLSWMPARERIMRTDDSPRTRPVRVQPGDRDGTKDIYNRFVYDKGASVLLMLEGWLGEDKMRAGVRSYLHDHPFGNASTEDLATELRLASGVDPSAVMHSFLDSTGLPRVSFQVECAAKPKLRIRQARASAIPVCYRGAGVAKTCVVLDGPAQDVDLPAGSACPTWIEPNAGGSGYYRTTWTPAQLGALPLADLSPAERLMLAFDLAAQSNNRDAARASLSRLSSDSEPEVAKAAQDALPSSTKLRN
jgi:alanyl aminopeptidase